MFQLPSFVARWTQRIHESIFENGREITFLIKLEFPIIAAIVHCLLLKPGDIPWNIISWSRDASLERNMIFVTRISRDPSIPWILSWILGHLRSIYIISILEENYIKFDSFDFLFLHYIYKKKKMYHKTFSSLDLSFKHFLLVLKYTFHGSIDVWNIHVKMKNSVARNVL